MAINSDLDSVSKGGRSAPCGYWWLPLLVYTEWIKVSIDSVLDWIKVHI